MGIKQRLKKQRIINKLHNKKPKKQENYDTVNLDSLKSKNSSSNLLPYNLPHLQNLIKRDPESYNEEFQKQYNRFNSLYELFLLEPSQKNANLDFIELIQFLAAISNCYKEKMIPDFSDKIVNLLNNFGLELGSEIRLALARVLITMRNKNILEPLELHKLCFKLFNISDKNMREVLYAFIIADIKAINLKSKNNSLNRQLQNYLYSIIHENDNKICCKMAVDALVELYKRQIWRDSKTVNVLASSCFSKFSSVIKACLTFFIEAGADDNDDSDESDFDTEEDELLDGPSAEDYIMKQIGASSKNTKKLKKKKIKAAELLEKLRRKRKKLKVSPGDGNFAALHLIHDPQDFAEKLFTQMQKVKENFDTKILYIDLIAKLIGIHELFLLNFYTWVEKWLSPQHKNVSKVLVSISSAAHEMVPPEILQQTIKVIANNFVTENNSSEVMAVGINSIREITKRCPLSMTEDLLQDLAKYKKHKQKSVSAAAKSLISTFRLLNKDLLARKDRGRPEDSKQVGFTSSQINEYGQATILDHIPGTEELVEDDSGCNLAINKILTQTDYETIKVKQIKRKLKMDKLEEKSKKQKLDDSVVDESDNESITSIDIETSKHVDNITQFRKERTRNEIVRPQSVLIIEGRKRNKDKEARMKSIEEGREDKSVHKTKNKVAKKVGGATNRQKMKNKAFTMVKHKVNSKMIVRSYQEKATRLRDALKKQANRSHKNRF